MPITGYSNTITVTTTYDTDAQAFFDRVATAGGTLSTTEKLATNQLVLDMKSAGIWTSMKAVYPMVGASAAACAQNLKSSSFTGSFTSGWTFSSTGATPNGTSAYMDSGFVPSTNVSLSSFCFSAYSRTGNTDEYRLWGILNSSLNYWTYMNSRNLSIDNGNNTNTYYTLSNLPTDLGLRMSNRNSLTQYNVIQNTNSNTIVSTANQLATINFYFGGTNGYASYCKQQIAFAHLSDGLTDTQASNFYTAVQAFQTTLSRQV